MEVSGFREYGWLAYAEYRHTVGVIIGAVVVKCIQLLGFISTKRINFRVIFVSSTFFFVLPKTQSPNLFKYFLNMKCLEF